MIQRERELQQTALVQRAYCLGCSHRWSINHQIQLRVVREFGMPDSAVEILQSAQHQQYEQDTAMIASHHLPAPSPSLAQAPKCRNLSARMGRTYQQRHQYHRPHQHSYKKKLSPSVPSSPARSSYSSGDPLDEVPDLSLKALVEDITLLLVNFYRIVASK